MRSVKKLFKQITVFDYVALFLMAVILVVSLVFFYRKSEYIEIKVKVASPSLIYPVFGWTDPYPAGWYSQIFKEGDVERDNLGRVTTEVVGVDTFNVSASKKLVYLNLKVRATYDSRSKSYSTRGKKLVFGTQLRFDLSGVTFDGYVVDFPGSDLQKDVKKVTKEIEVFTRGVPESYTAVNPKVFESIKEGDQIKDSAGNSLVIVKNVSLTPALRITTDDAGRVYRRIDPYFKDLTLLLKVQVKEINGELYIYDDLPLRIGLDLPFTFNTVSLQGVVTSIKDAQ